MDTVLDYPLRDGSTKRKHLLSVAKQSGKVPEELNVPEVDPCLLYVKYIFDNLSMTREYTNNNPTMIKEADIYYWCKLNHIELTPWHLLTLKKLDIAQINSLVTCQQEQHS